jgi:hypothetical protein
LPSVSTETNKQFKLKIMEETIEILSEKVETYCHTSVVETDCHPSAVETYGNTFVVETYGNTSLLREIAYRLTVMSGDRLLQEYSLSDMYKEEGYANID